MRGLASSLVLAFSAVACGDSFTPYNEVRELRVLAMRASPASPAPGETTTLDALVVSPSGEALTYAWSWCPLVGTASEGYPCLVDEAALRAELDQASAGIGATLPTFDLGIDATATLPHTVSPLIWQQVCGSLQSWGLAAAELDCLTAFPVTVLLKVQTATAELRAKKTVRLRYDVDGAGNNNPTVTGLALQRPQGSVTLDDLGTATAAADTAHDLRLDVPETAAESVTEADGSVSRERLLFTWFLDTGTMDAERTTFIDGQVSLEEAAQNIWTTPRAAEIAVNPATFWVVVHDSRGGVAWTSARVTIEVAP